jgi:uncharacterized protein
MRGFGAELIDMARTPKAEQPRAWQRMLSGRRLNLLDPSPLDVEIADIAHGLARVARWNGQTRGPSAFSVAQHSVLVEAIYGHLSAVDFAVSDRAKLNLMALLHDAPEYVIGDMISPFKSAVGDAYRGVEARLMAAIHLRFGLPHEASPVVAKAIKRCDRIAAFLEAVELAGFEREEALKLFGKPEPLPRAIHELLEPWPVPVAQERFLARFEELFSRALP